MSEKPGKRLVSKGEYALIVMGKSVRYVLSVLALLLGLALLAFGISGFSEIHSHPGVIVGIFFLGLFGIELVKHGRNFFVTAKETEPVRPITRHNTVDQSPQKTLVRASIVPPSHQQAELLRAVKPGQETPAEELLRASVSKSQE